MICDVDRKAGKKNANQYFLSFDIFSFQKGREVYDLISALPTNIRTRILY